ncbi:hypothetical protein M407DRAFT_22684 [Tulasnella calospora MUT 4182]|uniref:Mmc1 C-terminal domain-containing protein n=1 Tax=Tulasnella calospora MUT 4182 TaxID=1051891 RepID=A0A0C3M2X4_9AGAM|nr:hypothetical protein M407DRAFT_22684 [Tulasnella calospora MUT 4182]
MKPATTKVIRITARPSEGLRWARSLIKTASTAAALSPSSSTSPPKLPAEPVELPLRLATRNLLKSSIDLAKRTVERPTPLENAVNQSLRDLEVARKPVVAFCGDSKSGLHDIVTALLEEPLSNDQTRRNALVGRFDDRTSSGVSQNTLRIRSSDSLDRTGNVLSLRSSWLSSHGFDLLELPITSTPVSLLSDLVSADHIILITDNIRFSSQPSFASYIKLLANHPSLQIVLNRINKSTTAFQDEYTLASEIKSILEEETNAENRHETTFKISVVSSNDALEAIDIFRSVENSSNATAAAKAASMELYQAKHKASSISDLSSSLVSALPPTGSGTSSPSDEFLTQSRTGAFIASHVLASCQSSIDSASAELMGAERRVKNLREVLRAELLAAQREFFDSSSQTLGSPEPPVEQRKVFDGAEDMFVVDDSLSKSRRDVERILERYTWWNLPWRVDDLQDEVVGAVAEHYAKDLRANVHFHSGKLSFLSKTLSEESERTVAFPPTSPFNSAILQNTLSQISRSSSPHFSPPILTPISSRQSQISTHLVPQLQSRAERVVASFYALSFGSLGAAWASSPILFDVLGMETAIGVGALGVATSLRVVLLRGWERAVKKWWEGWDRVGEGLGRDVKVAYDEQVVPQLTRKPNAAANGLQELVEKREKDVAEVEEEMKGLTHTLEALQARIK